MKSKKISLHKYDAKSEKVFCESIPRGIKWDLHETVYTWTYSEVHSKDNLEHSKSYTKKYTPDVNFVSYTIELKGFLRPDAKKRMEIWRKLYPDVDLRIAFMKDLPITKKAKLTYTGWATKHGFQSCVAKTFDELPPKWQEDALLKCKDIKATKKELKGKCKTLKK